MGLFSFLKKPKGDVEGFSKHDLNSKFPPAQDNFGSNRLDNNNEDPFEALRRDHGDFTLKTSEEIKEQPQLQESVPKVKDPFAIEKPQVSDKDEFSLAPPPAPKQEDRQEAYPVPDFNEDTFAVQEEKEEEPITNSLDDVENSKGDDILDSLEPDKPLVEESKSDDFSDMVVEKPLDSGDDMIQITNHADESEMNSNVSSNEGNDWHVEESPSNSISLQDESQSFSDENQASKDADIGLLAERELSREPEKFHRMNRHIFVEKQEYKKALVRVAQIDSDIRKAIRHISRIGDDEAIITAKLGDWKKILHMIQEKLMIVDTQIFEKGEIHE